MVTRIVKLTFKEERVNDFLELFERTKSSIAAVEGNEYLSLLKDQSKTNVFFTLSQWKNEEVLENYRNSELFESVWLQTKSMFLHRAEAWTTTTLSINGTWHKP